VTASGSAASRQDCETFETIPNELSKIILFRQLTGAKSFRSLASWFQLRKFPALTFDGKWPQKKQHAIAPHLYRKTATPDDPRVFLLFSCRSIGCIFINPELVDWRVSCGGHAALARLAEAEAPLPRVYPATSAAQLAPFPARGPGAGMAAVRSGHVMILQARVAGDVWNVHDGNSGGHVTRDHSRSIAGYTIVDPGSAS
jgi:hypothetical protein